MADRDDKSAAVWCPDPSLGVPDTTEWASLCLWYDHVAYMSLRTLSFPRNGKLFERDKPPTAVEIAFDHVISELLREGAMWPFLTPPSSAPMTEWDRHIPDWFLERATPRMEPDGLSIYASDREFEACFSIVSSAYFRLPLVSTEPPFWQHHRSSSPDKLLSEVLATAAISQLALPAIRPAHVDDLLEARTALRDELLEFRAGILDLTYLLHQQVKGENELTQIRHEADVLVNTKIKAAVLSLEHRMQQHEKKRIRRMLFGTGRVLVDVAKLFLPGGWREKLMAGGKTLLQAAIEIDSAKLPEDQVATYLHKLHRQLKS
ncbi:MAG: hypothetical protein NTZ17_02100 [Phycisphaerae bacterium]|nr:hypothetical protein [Phycisphaerae bacterium]